MPPSEDTAPATALPPAPRLPSLADVLAHVGPSLPPVLIDGPGRAALAAVAGAVPSALSPFWGLEIRLGRAEARADILWEVKRTSRGRTLLAGSGAPMPEAPDLAPLAAAAPVWAWLRDFAAGWDESSGLRNLWMEADAAAARTPDAARAALRAPCLFWGPETDAPGSDRAALARLPELAAGAFGLSLDRAALARFAAWLPEEAVVFQMGAMGGRSEAVARLCLRGVAPEAVAGLADRIGWRGDAGALDRALAASAARAADIAVAFDLVGDRIGPRIGIEHYQTRSPEDGPRWAPFLAHLEAEGLARPDKLAALSAFPGVERYSVAAEMRDKSGRAHPAITRLLHHVKLGFEGDRWTEAKAYLGVYRPGVDYDAVFADPGLDDPWFIR